MKNNQIITALNELYQSEICIKKRRGIRLSDLHTRGEIKKMNELTEDEKKEWQRFKNRAKQPTC